MRYKKSGPTGMLTLYAPRKKEKPSIHLQLTFGTRFAAFLFFQQNLHQTFYAIQDESGLVVMHQQKTR
jgi:hypothetical protein